MTSAGCDVIIKNSNSFQSGKSQLFHLEKAKHLLFNAKESRKDALNIMDRFFDWEVLGHYDFRPTIAEKKRLKNLLSRHAKL